jgi:superfamily II DNA or RNA helicase
VSLSSILESKFRGDIRFRGQAYVKAERVAITRVTADELCGVVEDGIEYHTQLTRRDDMLLMTCSCAADRGNPHEVRCKHVWGTILLAEQAGYISDAARPNYFPPFTIVEERFDWSDDDEDWDEVPSGDAVPEFGAKQRRHKPAHLVVEPRLREWELLLNQLRTSMDSSEATPSNESRETELFYEIDTKQSQLEKQLVIGLVQRQRRNNGRWGKRKPLRVRANRFDDITREEDRRILATLLGGIAERSSWYAQQSELQAATNRFRVPFELAQLLMPQICATGRLRLQESELDTQVSRIVIWDEGPAWEMSVSLAFDEQAQRWQLQGHWQRGHESLPMRRTEFAVPGGLLLLPIPEKTSRAMGEFDREDSASDEDSDSESPQNVLKASELRGSSNSANGEIEGEESDSLSESIVTHRLCRWSDSGQIDWVDLLLRDPPLSVPDGEEVELVDRLLDMPNVPQLHLPKNLQLEEVRVAPIPQILIQSPRGPRWQQERLKAEVLFDYAGTLVRASSPQSAIVERDAGRCLIRDRAMEEVAWNQLIAAGCKRLIDKRRGAHDVEVLARELGGVVRNLMQKNWVVKADGKQVWQAGEVKFRVQSNIDWFELHGEADFGGRRITFPELLAALARGDSTVRLDDGTLGIIPEEWLKQFGMLAGLGTTDGDHLKFQAHQVGLLDALLASQPLVHFDARFAEVRDKLKSFSGVTPASEPAGFEGKLRAYQRDGVGWLRFLQEFQFGGCLADDMGLGKTVQMLAVLQDRVNQMKSLKKSERRPSLIVVPKSLLFNWRQECAKFTPKLRVLEYAGLDRADLRSDFDKYDVILTTYGTLRRDILVLKDTPFDYVVLDEAQTIKNSGSQVAKASRLLTARHRLALSGTPIENHLGDLWSIFEFLNPGMLGRSTAFRTHAADSDTPESREFLARGLRPFILRRTKQQVAADLPDKIEQTLYCQMSDEQARLYAELRDHYRQSLLGLIKTQGLAKSKMHVLEALLRLRQAACHPALLDKAKIDDSSAKLDLLLPHLEELIDEKHKTLIFSQFTSMLAILRHHLDQRGITYEYLDGQTRDRRGSVERFQNDDNCPLFLISLKAGGLGLNLTAADYVFLLDPWWNPAVEAQAIDRAHRVGQTKQVFAYRLICRDTVEEKIAELQTKKRGLADAILQENGSVLEQLSADDLEMLLS